MIRQLLLTSAITFTALGVAQADKITLSNGRVIEGRVISQDEKRVTIEVRGMITQLAASSVKSIEVSQDWENTFVDIETALKRRDAIRGLDLIFKASREGAPADRLAELIERYNGGIAGGIYTATAAEKTTLRVQMRQLIEQPELLTPKSLFLTSQNFYALEDWGSAAECISRISAEAMAEDAAMRNWSLGFLRQLVRRMVNRGDFQDAIRYAEEMWRLSGGEGSPDIILTVLHRASAARDRGDYQEAFRIIAEELQPIAPEIARNRLAYAREFLLRDVEVKQNYAAARTAIEPLEKRFPIEYRALRNGLLAREARSAYDQGDFASALALVSELPEAERDEEVEELRILAFHETEVSRIGESDPLALVQHARWAASNGLLDQAIAIFMRTRENENLREISDESIRLARRERDTILLEQANAAYRDGMISEAMPKVEAIIARQDVGSALTQEAVKLKELMTRSIAREREEAPYRAEVLYQQAERDYFMQNYTASFNQLNSVLELYPQTPAAKRASVLLGDVVRELEIAYLEGKPVTIPKLPARFDADIVQRNDLLSREVTALLDALGEDRRN